MKTCYLCNIELTEKNDHGEHIFQQALGGTLIEKGILCKECGNKLGKDIDVKFTSIFRNYTSRLPINFDRNTKKESEKGYIYIPKFNREFEFKAVKEDLHPIKPCAFLDPQDESRLIIIHPKSKKSKIEKYINLKKREFNITNESKIIIIQTFNDYENIWSMPFNLGNIEYKKGMAKIAIGFAIKNGVTREQLDCVLDCENNKIKDKLLLVPYMPWDFINGAIEEARFYIKNNLEYLSHQIKLFNIGCDLNCYIELFGTFQCYIKLSGNYTGQNIYLSYMQPIFKRKYMELKYLPEDYLSCDRDVSEIESTGYSDETKIKMINEALRKQPNKLDLEEYYSKLISFVIGDFDSFLSKSNNSKEPCKLQDFFEQNCDLSDEKILSIFNGLMKFSQNIKYIKQNLYTWNELCCLHKNNHDRVYQYNERKMHKLEELIKDIQNGTHNSSRWNTDFKY